MDKLSIDLPQDDGRSIKGRGTMIRAYYIFRRLGVLFMYSAIASLMFAYAAIPASRFVESKLAALTGDNDVASMFIAGLVSVALLFALHAFARAQIQHMRWLSYPSSLFAVPLGLLFSSLWPTFGSFGAPLAKVDMTVCRTLAASYLGFWIVQTSAMWLVDRGRSWIFQRREIQNTATSSRSLEQLTDEEIAQWVDQERPIDRPGDDLFGFSDFTTHVLEKLARAGNTVAIQGAFGSGKTSFIQLLEQRAAEQGLRLWFVRVSCWGFESSLAAQRALLLAMIGRLADEVDCLCVRNLPREYTSAVAKKIEWANFLTASEENPLAQLRRVTPLLTAIDAGVVLVVEDVDRIGKQFDVGTVFSLLAQLRQVEGLSFILPIAPAQAVDFAKLCEFTEFLPVPSSETVLSICERVRNALCKTYADDILVDKVQDLSTAVTNRKLTMMLAPTVASWPEALALLVAAPRILKGVLRRLRFAWSALHGEVSIDALLMTCALRESAPAAFSFLQAELDTILFVTDGSRWRSSSDQEHRQTLQERLKIRWQEVVARREFNTDPVEILILHLFPGTSFLSKLKAYPTELRQGPSGKRAAVYAQRLFTEHLGAAA